MKNRKAEAPLAVIMLIVVGVLFAMAIIPEIFNQQATQTTKTPVTNEAVNIAPARLSGGTINTTYPFTVAKAYASDDWQYLQPCVMTGVVYGNSTADWTVTTDYTFNTTTGVLLLKNTATVNNSATNSTLIDYTYCQDGYNQDSGSRSIAGLIGLFVALALVAFIIGLGIKKEWFD